MRNVNAELLQFEYSDADFIFLQMLLLVPGLGRRTAGQILLYLKKHETNPNEFWVSLSDVIVKIGIHKNIVKSLNKTYLEQEYYSIKKVFQENNIRVVAFWETAYPNMLLATEDFPLVLYVRGSMGILKTPSMAVVGTRKNTSYGEMVTKKLVLELVEYGYTITSGCMYGIDALAHQTALDTNGKTIAVLGYGFQAPVSIQMKRLQESILEKGGCLLTEYLPYVCANKGTFPERNRIVAGLSLGVLVVEAALNSGTHITVGCALDAGREVFAVPGSIFNPYTEGTKYLLNQGAKLVSNARDMVAEFQKAVTIPSSWGATDGFEATGKTQLDLLAVTSPDDKAGQLAQQIVLELTYLPQASNTLAEKLNIPIQELLTTLGMLELENVIRNEAGLWQSMI